MHSKRKEKLQKNVFCRHKPVIPLLKKLPISIFEPFLGQNGSLDRQEIRSRAAKIMKWKERLLCMMLLDTFWGDSIIAKLAILWRILTPATGRNVRNNNNDKKPFFIKCLYENRSIQHFASKRDLFNVKSHLPNWDQPDSIRLLSCKLSQKILKSV